MGTLFKANTEDHPVTKACDCSVEMLAVPFPNVRFKENLPFSPGLNARTSADRVLEEASVPKQPSPPPSCSSYNISEALTVISKCLYVVLFFFFSCLF